MTLLEAINVRKSRRKYEDRALSSDQIQHFEQLMAEYNEIGGFRVGLITDNKSAFANFSRSYGMLVGVNHYFVFIGDDADIYADEKIGYYGELLTLHATTLGLGTCWVGGTFNKSKIPFKLAKNERIACLITVGKVADAPNLREKLIHNLTHRKTKTAAELFESKGEVPDWFWQGINAVMRAPSSMNSQPIVFDYSDDVVSAVNNGNFKHMNSIDLGIAKLHFELAAGGGSWELGSGGKFERGVID